MSMADTAAGVVSPGWRTSTASMAWPFTTATSWRGRCFDPHCRHSRPPAMRAVSRPIFCHGREPALPVAVGSRRGDCGV